MNEHRTSMNGNPVPGTTEKTDLPEDESGSHPRPPSVLVTIWHNIATDHAGRPLGMLDGYQNGHPLVPVARYEADLQKTSETPGPIEGAGSGSETVLDLAHDAFRIFNVGDDPSFTSPPDPRAVRYRRQGNRSLSVGDVVQVDDTWLSCERSGWREHPRPSWVCLEASAAGTSPLSRNSLLPSRADASSDQDRNRAGDSFAEAIAKVRALATEHGIEFHELRQFASAHLNATWAYPDQGIGSSDVNHHLVSLARTDMSLLIHEAERLQERNELLAELSAITGRTPEQTMTALRELLAPIDDTPTEAPGGAL